MRVEILGSGGATPTPRPGCSCRACAEARELGVPHSRTGPSLFVHGPDILFDTPEESRLQVDRAGLARVAACFYSHWHPDHTMGRRVFETRNFDFRSWPREAKRSETTRVFLPQQVAADFRTFLGAYAHLEFMADRQGTVEIVELADGEEVVLDGVRVRPFRLAEDYVYAFLLEDGDRRVLIAMDELHGWAPRPELGRLDLAVLPMGICEHHPLTGERRIDPAHPALRFEATFAETLGVVRALDARRVVLSHVEEVDGLTVDDLARVAEREGVEFAYDTMVLDL